MVKRDRRVLATLLIALWLSGCGSSKTGSDGSTGATGSTGGTGSTGATDPDTYTDEEVALHVLTIGAVEGQVRQLLAARPTAAADEILTAIRGAAGVTDAGAGEGGYWAELGVGGPVLLVLVNPTPYASAPPNATTQSTMDTVRALVSGPGAPDRHETADRALTGFENRYRMYQTSFHGSLDRNPEIAALLDSQGYRREGVAATLGELRVLSGVKLLHIHTHGMVVSAANAPQVKVRGFYMVTGSEAPNDPTVQADAATRADLAARRVWYLSLTETTGYWGIPIDNHVRRYAINHLFVQKYFRFEEDSLFFLNACHGMSAGAADWKAALFGAEVNLGVYAGWDDTTDVPDMGKASVFFYDRLLGTNTIDPVPDPRQRPFDYDSVRNEMMKNGLDKATFYGTSPPTVSTFSLAKNPKLGGRKAGLAPSIESTAVDEKKKEVTITGIFPPDPGDQRRTVTVGGAPATVKPSGWTPTEIKIEVGDGQTGDVVVTADDHVSNTTQLTEWSLTFTHDASTVLPDGVGSGQGSATFDVRFRGDVHEFRKEAGDTPMNLVMVPFVIENGSQLSWSGTATALGQTQPFSGTTQTQIEINYLDDCGNDPPIPCWPFHLPDSNFLVGEGYIDLTMRRLFLLLVGVGDKSGGGTFNLGPITDCPYYREVETNRVYMWFDLDQDFKIADGSCTDQIPYESSSGNGILTNGTRRWQFTTRNPPAADAAR